MSDSDSDDDGFPEVPLEPIHRAAIDGDLAALRRELEAGVSPDCHSLRGSPLQILCSGQVRSSLDDDIRLQGVQLLLAAGASPDRVAGWETEHSALCNAAYNGHPAIVKVLIAAGADATRADADGWTPLHSAASWDHTDPGTGRKTRSASCAVALLEVGAAVDAQHRDDLGQVYTPLLWNLSSFGQATSYVLPVLLRAGATVDMALAEEYSNEWLGGAAGYRYLAKVHAAGGWKRYAQAHTARLAPIVAKAFPHARLPPELVSHIVDLWAHVGYY